MFMDDTLELGNIEPIDVEEDIVKTEEKARSIRFKDSTFRTLSDKWYAWRRTKAIKKEIKEDIKIATKTDDEEFQANIMKHISNLMSEYKFLKTDTEDTVQLIGDRAIKLNENMTESLRKNRKMILKALKDEINDAEYEVAKSVDYDEQKEFVDSVNDTEEYEIPSEEDVVIPEVENNEEVVENNEGSLDDIDLDNIEPIAEENEEENEFTPEENVAEENPEVEEKDSDENVSDTSYGMTKEEIVQDLNVNDIESEQKFDAVGMSDDEIIERRIDLGLATPEEIEKYEEQKGQEVDLNEDIFKDEDNESIEITEDSKEEYPSEEETPVEKEEEPVVEAKEDVARMDFDEFSEKRKAFEEAMRRKKETLEKGRITSEDIEAAREEMKNNEEERKAQEEAAKANEEARIAKERELEEKEREVQEKLAALSERIQSIYDEAADMESKQQEYQEISERNKELSEGNKELAERNRETAERNKELDERFKQLNSAINDLDMMMGDSGFEVTESKKGSK